MKKLITIILIFVASASIAQDTLLFGFINQYRVKNGKKAIVWSEKLAKTSIAQTNKIEAIDSLYHSGTNTYENIVKGTTITSTPADKAKFTTFLKKNFNINYVDPANDAEVKTITTLYIIYLWDASSKHKANMLKDDVTEGSVHVIIKDIKFVSNKVTVAGKTVEFKNSTSYYNVIFYSTLNLK